MAALCLGKSLMTLFVLASVLSTMSSDCLPLLPCMGPDSSLDRHTVTIFRECARDYGIVHLKRRPADAWDTL